ncbi:MAG: hypothetical protein WDN26_02230 [Chitinophagaceae bacterium]
MLSSEQNPEECDATGDDSSTTARLILLIPIKKERSNYHSVHNINDKPQTSLNLCAMTIEKLNDMRSRIAGVRRFL